MLRRLIFFIAAAAIGYGIYWIRKKILYESAPPVPEGWNQLGEAEPRFKEVLGVRARLIKLVRRHQSGDERRRLMDDVHGCAEAIAELVERRQDLLRYMQESQAAANSAELKERAVRLDEEISESLSSLRQVYADMLAALERSGSAEDDAAKKTHDLLDNLRQRAQAEREIAQALRETE